MASQKPLTDWRDFVGPGDRVFDVGANAGNKTELFLRQGASVVCIEPQPDCVAALQKRFQGNPKVVVAPQGLAEKPGTLELSICSAASTLATFSPQWKTGRFAGYQWDHVVPVPVTTLDELIAGQGAPRYCKIDVEGFELSVLKGLSRAVPLLSFEFTREFIENAEACVAYLREIGYREFNFTVGEDSRFVSSKWLGADELFLEIARKSESDLWGDIYAYDGKTPARPPPVLGQGDDNLGLLKAAGRWRETEPLRLHLGCGEQHFEGFVNIDYPPEHHQVMRVRADAYANVLQLNFPAGSVDEIRLHHLFEHFNRVTALAMLIKWHTWLKDGGRLHIETPDLMGSAKNLTSPNASRKTKMGAARHLAGDHSDAWAYHLDHWFPERFERTLTRLGFQGVKTRTTSWPQEPFLANVEATAEKAPRSPEQQLEAADELLRESTVADAEKPTFEVWTRQLRAVLSGTAPPPPLNAVAPDLAEIAAAKKALARPPGAERGGIISRFFSGEKAAPEPSLGSIHNFNQLERDKWVEAKAATVPPGKLVLDVGAGTCPYRRSFAHCDYRAHDFKRYDGIKLGNTRDYGHIDWVSEITEIPLPDGSVDVVLCTEVLEHVPEPIAALREMARLVKPGGRVLLTAPLGSGRHQMPYHFYGGFTPEWYERFGPQFGLRVVEITPNGGFFKLLAQECARFAWTFEDHRAWHGAKGEDLRQLFGELLPRYLFALDQRHPNHQFTVGYHVEMNKLESAAGA